MSIEAQSTIETFAKVAGLGGLSLFVFVLLFKEVIRKRIFPKLSPEHGYKIIRLFLVLVFAFSSSGLASYVYLQTPGGKASAYPPTPADDPLPIIIAWMGLIDQGNYQQVWAESDPEYVKKTISAATMRRLTENVRNPAGTLISRRHINSGRALSPNGYPPGHYAYANFESDFSDGKVYFESVSLRGTEAGWKPYSYNFAPKPVLAQAATTIPTLPQPQSADP